MCSPLVDMVHYLSSANNNLHVCFVSWIHNVCLHVNSWAAVQWSMSIVANNELFTHFDITDICQSALQIVLR